MPELTVHAVAEIAALGRVAADQSADKEVRVKALLTIHQRLDAGRCLCGWSQLGLSFAGHQAKKLAEAGLLRAPEWELLAQMRHEEVSRE